MEERTLLCDPHVEREILHVYLYVLRPRVKLYSHPSRHSSVQILLNVSLGTYESPCIYMFSKIHTIYTDFSPLMNIN